ncbi:hypothetical protein V6N11_030760 [Hibiscus sabdariffa]|uniref:Uncharacterized protein n=1 Tax=Hibiscus sabdariffa TaxID=183260 RepID=A0ABR2NBN0_9ROSI
MSWASVASAVTTIGKLVAEEAKDLWGVREKVDVLLGDLKWMQNFLANEAGDETNHLQTADIRELAYDAENVVETYALKIGSERKPGVTNRIKRYVCILHQLWMLYETRSNIDEIIAGTNVLVRRLNAYQSNKSRGGSSSLTDMKEKRQPFPHIIDENIVGLDVHMEKLVGILVNEGSEHMLVSMCGTAGLGKTTLAKKIHQHFESSSNPFQYRAFVYVSKQFQRKQVWEDILSKLISSSTEERSSNRSDSLSQLNSHSTEGRSNFEELERKMVQRCPKLPLAIVALGKILAEKKNSLTGWHQVSDNVESSLRNAKVKELTLEQVLALSYDDLPCHLKSCFLYLSHFPEDYEIETYRLIELLVAEGIAPTEKKGEIAEDVAEGYLMDLAERFMIQPRRIDPVTSKFTSFQLHDEMRLLCLSKAEQENFVFIVDESNACSSSRIRMVRRISAHKCFETQRIECPNLRSLSFFNTHDLGELFNVEEPSLCEIDLFHRLFWYDLAAYLRFLKARGFWVHIFTNLKLLRVLNYDGWDTYARCKLIGDIGNLIHLRFLSLYRLKFEGSKLPSSLGNLICLQTLDLRVNVNSLYRTHVPDVLWRMKQLRHLYLPIRCTENTKLKLGTLENLQTLENFNTQSCYVEDLINMPNLRKLVIWGPFTIEELDKNVPIIQGKYLHTLSIYSSRERIDPRLLNHLLSSCVSICTLILEGKISKLPELSCRCLNLAYISLARCKLRKDPMSKLEKLSNLRILRLIDFTDEREMVCSAHGFPKLESLSLWSLNKLEQWKVDEGAMPCLRQLEIGECQRLKRLPDGLRFITTLQNLKIRQMPQAFKDNVVPGGPDFDKVEHVSSVIFQNLW